MGFLGLGIEEIMADAAGAGILAIPAMAFVAAGIGCTEALVAGIVFGSVGFHLAAAWA